MSRQGTSPMEPNRLSPPEIQRLIHNSHIRITRTSLEQRREHIYFQGTLEKRAGNFTLKSSWHERYFVLATVLLRVNPDPNTPAVKSTGLFYFEIEDDDPHCQASMESPLQGYFDLAFYCNVKARSGKDPAYRYLTVIRCPHQDEDDVKELRLRALKTTRHGEHMPGRLVPGVNWCTAACQRLNGFRDICIEHIRENNQASIAYQRAFDRELYQDIESNFVPQQLMDYVKNYLEISPSPAKGCCLLVYIWRLLDSVIGSTEGPDSQSVIYAAKSATGLAAAAARALFKLEEEGDRWQMEWRHMQALQEYQIRQLIELELFCPGKGWERADRRVNLFIDWIRKCPEVTQMQQLIDQKLPRFASSERYMQLDDFWAAKLRQERGGQFETLQGLHGLLTPSLQMVCAMEKCTTPVQKVRLWAEAIVEAISLIQIQFGDSTENNAIGGPDIPSLVLFLVCSNECKELYVEAKLARLFCLDNYGEDCKDFGLHASGLYNDLAEQYAFQAEKRSIDHAHYLLWVEDTLRIVAEAELTPRNSPGFTYAVATTEPRLLTLEVDAAAAELSLEQELSPAVRSLNLSAESPIVNKTPQLLHMSALDGDVPPPSPIMVVPTLEYDGADSSPSNHDGADSSPSNHDGADSSPSNHKLLIETDTSNSNRA